jgi:hypothetical protein
MQKASTLTPKTHPKPIKNQSKNRRGKKEEKTSKKDAKMEPKGIPEFPGKSRKSFLKRQRRPIGPKGSPNGPLRTLGER